MWRQRSKQFLASTTVRLAGTYIAIIMLMSVGFSAVFYNTSSHQLGRQVPPPSLFDNTGSTDDNQTLRPSGSRQEFDEFFRSRIEEGRRDLLVRLVWLNLGALVAGSLISYYLARRTLQPIEDAIEAQSQFVSDASHELRTPLTALQTTNEVALRKPNLTQAQSRELIAYNIAEAIKLKTLSDALLGLLKNDDHAQHLQSADLSDIVSDAINKVIPLAMDKKVSIIDNTNRMHVTVNKLSIVQIMTILLDNAVKYSTPGKKITISSEQKGRYVFLRVIDQGIGIHASDLPHIFRRFYRADKSRTSQNVNGYGLGLAIAQKLAQANHATLTATSTPGSGSTFTIRLLIGKQ